MSSLPTTVHYIGFDGKKVDGKNINVEKFESPVPTPSDDDVLIHVTHSSINPLDWKLALYNWFQRTDKAPLGYDIAGKAVKVGKNVTHIQEGDDVVAYAFLIGNGVWGGNGKGSYQTTHKDLLVKRNPQVPAEVAGVVAVAWLPVYDGMKPNLKENHKVYIPGGAGGVAHYAIEYAKTYAGVDVISSASRAESIDIAKKAGARDVFNYKSGNVAEEVKKAFNGSLADFVYDSTYLPSSHITSAEATAENGTLVILGELPDKNNKEFHSIVESKQIKVVQSDLIRYFFSPEFIKMRNNGFLRDAFNTFQELYINGEKVKPLITKTINGTLEQIRKELEENRNGRGLGKVAVNLVY